MLGEVITCAACRPREKRVFDASSATLRFRRNIQRIFPSRRDTSTASGRYLMRFGTVFAVEQQRKDVPCATWQSELWNSMRSDVST